MAPKKGTVRTAPAAPACDAHSDDGTPTPKRVKLQNLSALARAMSPRTSMGSKSAKPKGALSDDLMQPAPDLTDAQLKETVGPNNVLKYTPLTHISKRYPGLKGLLRLKAMYSDYVVDRNHTAMYFNDNHERLLTRHDDNDRDVMEVALEFAVGILHGGVRSDNRGKPIIIPVRASPDCEHFKLAGGGTVADGVYIAEAKEPENEQVIATIDQGCECCVKMVYGAPSDVVTEMIAMGNIDHRGTGITIAVGWRTVPKADRSWDAHAKANHITKRSCQSSGPKSYNKRRHQHILEEFEHIWTKGEHYDQCAESYSKLADLGIVDEACKVMGRDVVHNAKSQPDPHVIWAMANVVGLELKQHPSLIFSGTNARATNNTSH